MTYIKGGVPWNKGVNGYHIHSDEHKIELSKKFKGRVSPMKGRKHTPKTLKKMSLTRRGMKWSKGSRLKFSDQQKGRNNPMFGKTHSNKYKQWLKEKWRKDKNPNWKGGITGESDLRLSNVEWHKIRNSVYERDNWICQKCGTKCTNGKNPTWKTIQCHHKIAWRDGGWDTLENLITLCVRCHTKIEMTKI